MTGADAIIKSLQKEGVEYVFGYPGVAICPFYNSILGSGIRTVLVRQEQNAAHEASGYARISGKVGVAVVTSGPGATNLITGIATAFADSIPLVCITGQVESTIMGSDGFQEADISGACESFVKYSYIVRNPQDIPRIVKEAFHIASTGRKGPVLIDIPHDVQMARIERFDYPETVNLRTYKPTVEGHAVQIRKVKQELKRCKRPLVCAGGGVHLSGACEGIRTFIEKYNIPIVTTMMGLGAVPTDHPLCFGMVGNNGRPYGNRAMKEADMVIMVGARVADRSIREPDLVMEDTVLAHIDVDPAEIGKNAGPTIPLVGDIEHIFREFNREDLQEDFSDWANTLAGYREDFYARLAEEKAEQTEKAGMIHPADFVRMLSGSMEDDAVYVADVGQNQLWSCQNVIMREGRFLTSGGMGTMGYAVPAALGAKLAAPDRQVVAVCGDGGFQMNMMELATIRQYEVPVKIVVLRNNTLGLVRQHQHFAYKDRYSMVDLTGSPNLEKIAEAYSIPYLHIGRASEAEAVIGEFLAGDRTVLLEVEIDPDATV